MKQRLIAAVIAVLSGCHHNPAPKLAAPASPPAEPISVTVAQGDFVVVGKQENGIAVYLTIDRREKTCLVEVQNATGAELSILDSWTDSSMYRGVGLSDITVESPSAKPPPLTPATMTSLMPAQVSGGSLNLPATPARQQVRFRLYVGDPMLTKWMDVESPVFEVMP